MNDLNLDKLKSVLPGVPGILRKDEYFNSAVLIPLVRCNGEYCILFEKRGAGIRQGSEICFPGGEYDKDLDNNYEETAVRETVEELGIPKEKIEIIGNLDVLIGSMGVTIDPFLGVIKIQSLDELAIDKTEVEKAFLIPLKFFLDNEPEKFSLRVEVHPFYTKENGEKIELFPVKELDLPPRYLGPWQHKKHVVYAYRTPEGTIWGMTAQLLREAVRIIKLSL